MKIFMWNEIKENASLFHDFFSNGTGISIGSFDGLHQGHRALLEMLCASSKKRGIKSGVFSFLRPLPSFKHSNDYKGDLSTLNIRLRIFEELGLDFAIIADFNNEFAQIEGTAFLKLLMNVCNMKFLAEGADFRCGYKGATDVLAISYFARGEGLEVEFLDPVFYRLGTVEEERVSSSYIRSMVLKGFFSTVTELLTRPYEIELYSNGAPFVFKRESILQAIPMPSVYQCKVKENFVRVQVLKDKIVCEFEKGKEIAQGKTFYVQFE